jgi:hydroxymethylpyrimidine/phosphomethylpyrimidine kinase
MVNATIPVVMTIAGSDSGGGAGIQADLRTFAMHTVHGTSAITCVTAQNTVGVQRVDALPAASVAAQIKAVADDIGIQAAKTGMLLNSEIIETVAATLRDRPVPYLVVDPVMVSRAGARLINDDAIAALRSHLFPLASVITPNRYEAQILSDRDIHSIADMRAAASTIFEMTQIPVLVKGGAMPDRDRGVDIWYDGKQLLTLKTQCVETQDTHGTGCTLSAAIAANLAKGLELTAAVQTAKTYVTQALKYSLRIGQGQGPVGHFFQMDSPK